MLALFVNGGEVTTFLGVYSDRTACDVIINEERDGGFTDEEGYERLEHINDQGSDIVLITQSGPDEWSLMFTIQQVELNVKADVTC